MAKKSAEKTALIDMSGFQARPKVIDGQSPAVNASTQASLNLEKPRTFTGVSSVIAGITVGLDTTTKLIEATRKLAEFDGAMVVKNLDTKLIRRSQWANRIDAEFRTEEFRLLKDEIQSAGGNVQPIKVRKIIDEPVIDGQSPRYEIVFGHRRYQACVELDMSVNAIVVDEMDDLTLFEAMDRENRNRKNLSAWEQGRMYSVAIKKGLYPSIRKLCEALGVNQSDASRSVQLAKLPLEVVAAFSSPLDLQVRWAKPLAEAMQSNPDGMLAIAQALKKSSIKLPAGDVFDRLIGRNREVVINEVLIQSDGKALATLKTGPKGRMILELEAGVLPPDKHATFSKLIKDFLIK